jgi:hypothetical protein
MFSYIKTQIIGIFFLSIIFIAFCGFGISTNAQVENDSEVTIRLNATIIAEDDTASTEINTPIIVKVLSNDKFFGSDVNTNTLKIIQQPQNGTVIVDGDSVEYTPNQDYTGQDYFTYEICNLDGQCDEAEVIVTITGEREDPKEEPKKEPSEEEDDKKFIPPNIPEEEPKLVISLPRTGGATLGAGIGIGFFAGLLAILLISRFYKKNEEINRKGVKKLFKK